MSEQGPEYADPSVYRELAGFDGDWRDTWWNSDFLAFVLDRWGVRGVREVLDVGCGAGHWGRSLLRVLGPAARLEGVDREPSFPALATSQAREKSLADRTHYQRAEAESLPFADESFDVVTCQTVLIHVANAKIALREMIRVLRPGGFLIAAEPDNFSSAASLLSIDPRPSDADLLGLLTFKRVCDRGKLALGEGDETVGGRLPGYLHELGLGSVRVSTNENCPELVPPYEEGTQALQLATELGLSKADCSMFTGTREDSRRAFLAGGGTTTDFDTHWDQTLRFMRSFEQAAASGELRGARGQLFYLVSGRRTAAGTEPQA